jgi:hypothetical protein
MSAWVTSQVVNKVKLTDRVNAIKKFITLGKVLSVLVEPTQWAHLIYCFLFMSEQKLAECNNFNGVMQIMSGLHSSPVSRLKKSWEVHSLTHSHTQHTHRVRTRLMCSGFGSLRR